MRASWSKALLFAALGLSLNSMASINDNEVVSSGDATVYATPHASYEKQINLAGIYVIPEDSEAVESAYVIKGKRYQNITKESIDLNQNEHVAVRFDALGNAEVTLLLNPEEQGKVPEKLILSKEEFARLGLKFEAEGNSTTLFQNYSYYDDTDVARNHGGTAAGMIIHNTHAHGCVNFVRSRVQIPESYGCYGNGVGTVDHLIRTGAFSEASCGSPQEGMVISFSGGSGAGHTGKWNSHLGCFDSDSVCTPPGVTPNVDYYQKNCAVPNGRQPHKDLNAVCPSGGGRGHGHRRHR
jgi:hypothetical protein